MSKDLQDVPTRPSKLDFAGNAEEVRAVAAGARLRHAYQHNPRFAAETSLIDPLPHQRIAVYERMLEQPRLRFLLADDAGAGKTIMTGLYIREMLSRRLIDRILIVPPAGLVGNWKRELAELFSLDFEIIRGADAKDANPFCGDRSDHLIVSVDTLASSRTFDRLKSSEVTPYDLVVFDEAHKLSARRRSDGYVKKTQRYKLGEALAGVPDVREEQRLPWSTHHLLLLTATPHQGKDYPYYALWRLLEPDALASQKAFDDYPADARRRHFIRRPKEQMVDYSDIPIFPTRVSRTLSYNLNAAEKLLYDETTKYLEEFYNKATILNDDAIHLAKCVFQRRLVSSTYALRESFLRRRDRLANLLVEIRDAQRSGIDLRTGSPVLGEELQDLFASATADEEQLDLPGVDLEANERAERDIIDRVMATSPEVLAEEREFVDGLIALADDVLEAGDESKFQALTEWLESDEFDDDKLLVFTEHRDTLDFLKRRLEGLGYTGWITVIHGGMDYRDRDDAVDEFKRPTKEGGAQFMLATDAAGEGINLQFCWRMINYDIPWNPARLEQRMGRLHRYGQDHDPVQIFNLVSQNTREGHVQEVLLEKLERIREEFGSDKVFDVIGEVLEDAGVGDLLSLARNKSFDPEAALGKVDTEQLRRVHEQREGVYEKSADVSEQVEEFNAKAPLERARHLLPAQVTEYVGRCAPLVGLRVAGELGGHFQLRPERPHALDPLWNVLETHSEIAREHMTARRPKFGEEAIWMRPGEKVFDRFMALVDTDCAESALCGGVFEDPKAPEPYLAFLYTAQVRRRGDDQFEQFRRPTTLRRKLFGVRVTPNGEIKHVDPMRWRLYKPSDRPARKEHGLVAVAFDLFEKASEFACERFAATLADDVRHELEIQLDERVDYLKRGYRLRTAELAQRRTKLKKKADDGKQGAAAQLEQVKRRQSELYGHHERRLAAVRREPELVEVGTVEHIASAMILPTERDEAARRRKLEIEQIAVDCAVAFEIDAGRTPHDVSTPELATAFGLPEWPGYDIHSVAPDGTHLAIEVKGRARRGELEFGDNEYSAAVNRDDFWVYAVYDCATSNPAIYRFQPDESDFEPSRYVIYPQTVQKAAEPVLTPKLKND